MNIDNIVDNIIHTWSKDIESINIDGYSRRIESIESYQTGKYYKGYPAIEYCYKVSFNFTSGLSDVGYKHPREYDGWTIELDKYINKIAQDSSKIDYITNQGYRVIFQFYPLGFIEDLRNDKLKSLGL